ncbi:MAG: SIR2 family protein, partial [Acidobacteria bacterium]|nr:SIR2 family protein [Acidobacteriota bacterium]
MQNGRAELTLRRACRSPSKTTLLVGAGVRVDPPSNIPLAGPIMDLLCEWLSRGAPDVRDALNQMRQPARVRKPYLGPYATLRFELLLEWIAYVEPRILDVLARSVQWGTPNQWHWWIADMISRGSRVLTTNFDTRIEEACRALNIPCTTAVLSRQAPPADALRTAQLIKLHGSFAERKPFVCRSTAPVATLRQMSRWGLGYERLGPARDELLRMIGEHTLIVCGYSGSDSFDVMPLLEDAPRSAALVWYEWAHGPLREVALTEMDTLTTRRTTASMSDVFLAHRGGRHSSLARIRGSAPAFLRLVTGSRPRRAGPAAETRRSGAESADEVLQEMRTDLFSGELRLRPTEAREIVLRLRLSQGADINDIHLGLKGRRGAAPRPMRHEADVLTALDVGDIRAATAEFLAEIRRAEEPGDRVAQAETVTSILAEMFWFAIRNG